jgi:RNA polymerase sigma factor (sigma-70 family)
MVGEQSRSDPAYRTGQPDDDLPALVRAAAAGDQAAWDRLVERFSGLLWSICRSYRLDTSDAADVFQLTWLRLLERLDTIQDPARLPGWLATTCRRECLSFLRRNGRAQPTDDDRVFDHRAGDAPGADRPILESDRNAGLWRAFAHLSGQCQRILRVLVVTAEDGPPSYEVAAAALGLPTGSLGPTRRRCLHQLRKLLDAEGISGFAIDS